MQASPRPRITGRSVKKEGPSGPEGYADVKEYGRRSPGMPSSHGRTPPGSSAFTRALEVRPEPVS